jgi:Glycosyl hydrolase family 79, N-terminal domain
MYPRSFPVSLLPVHAAALILSGACLQATPPTNSSSPVTKTRSVEAVVSVSVGSKGDEIPSDFTGFSFETLGILPGTNGIRSFRPDNEPMLRLFRTLGIKSLRIGGNTGDRDFRTAPSPQDIDSLLDFAKEADAKVIYCLRLLNADPIEQARVAKVIAERHPGRVEFFSIGQEPSAYPVSKVDTRRADERMGAGHEHYPYGLYATNWDRAAGEVAKAVPDVRLAGPGVHRETKWPLAFLGQFAKSGRISLLTAHLYPGGAGGAVTNAVEGRDRMLSGEFEKSYRDLAMLIPAAASNNIPFRLEEANNFYNGGAADVSDTYAASLWGLDFLWWWASHGAAGVNFHTGDKVAAGSLIAPCRYASFHSVPGGIHALPLAYGIKAFNLGAQGRIVPLELSFPKGSPPANLSAYAAVDSNTMLLTLINKEHGADAAVVSVDLNVNNPAGDAERIVLSAPGRDVSAKENISVGGSAIGDDGGWTGIWSPVSPYAPGRFRIEVSPASAVILRVPLRIPVPSSSS